MEEKYYLGFSLSVSSENKRFNLQDPSRRSILEPNNQAGVTDCDTAELSPVTPVSPKDLTINFLSFIAAS